MSETSPQRGGRDAVALLRSSVAHTRVWVFCSMQHVVNDSILQLSADSEAPHCEASKKEDSTADVGASSKIQPSIKCVRTFHRICFCRFEVWRLGRRTSHTRDE
jgi:hypothetical protein